jgi:hypothetical protein
MGAASGAVINSETLKTSVSEASDEVDGLSFRLFRLPRAIQNKYQAER